MKKQLVYIIGLIIIFLASCTPETAVTATPAPTLTPTSTPTLPACSESQAFTSSEIDLILAPTSKQDKEDVVFLFLVDNFFFLLIFVEKNKTFLSNE